MTRGVGGHGPANIMTHLKGIDFPADKKKILSHAKQSKGPGTKEVMDVLNRLPEQQYNTAADVMKAMGQSKGQEGGQQKRPAKGQEKGQSKGHSKGQAKK